MDHSITENMTNPNVATTIGGTAIVANLIGFLPVLINVFVAIYFLLMIMHKVYQMWKEYKQDKASKDNEDEPS